MALKRAFDSFHCSIIKARAGGFVQIFSSRQGRGFPGWINVFPRGSRGRRYSSQRQDEDLLGHSRPVIRSYFCFLGALKSVFSTSSPLCGRGPELSDGCLLWADTHMTDTQRANTSRPASVPSESLTAKNILISFL